MNTKRLSTMLLLLVFFLGLSILAYPTVSNAWNRHTQTRVAQQYETDINNLDDTTLEDMLQKAETYNRALAQLDFPLLNYIQLGGYEEQLNAAGNGVMGILTIDKIRVRLPIYHGVSDAVLAVGAGHLPGSSLPVGGPGSHAVISAHRGLPSARLFSDLDQLREGDLFTVSVFNRQLTYQVDQIRIVKPEEVGELRPVAEKDYCTLLTCTPYGVNTHRMLVRGIRVDNERPMLYVFPEAYQLDSLLLAPVAAVPLLLLLLVVLILQGRKRKH